MDTNHCPLGCGIVMHVGQSFHRGAAEWLNYILLLLVKVAP